MRYLPELFYLQDQTDFPFRKAVLVTATTVSHWCSHYHARVIVAKSKQVTPRSQSGSLPQNIKEREALVAGLVTWLLENSPVETLFYLMLDDEPLGPSDQVGKFDHPDDTGSWALDLSEDEFVELQTVWKEHSLPGDLFYPEGDTVCLPYPGQGLKASILRLIGVQKCFTPRQWAMHASD
jgi:hypothetical protein